MYTVCHDRTNPWPHNTMGAERNRASARSGAFLVLLESRVLGTWLVEKETKRTPPMFGVPHPILVYRQTPARAKRASSFDARGAHRDADLAGVLSPGTAFRPGWARFGFMARPVFRCF